MRMTILLTLFKDHGHGSTLVENTQLALGRLLVGGVGKDTAVEKSSVGIGNHATDISRTVRLAALLLGHLHGVAPFLDGVRPPQRVTLVDRIDGTLCGHLHVGVGEDKFTKGSVHGEAVDGAVLHGQNEF